jgi:hypothetical protein
MMRFKFIGKYTNGHRAVVIHGVTFEGHKPVTVDNDDTIKALKTHQEVEIVTGRPPKDEADD